MHVWTNFQVAIAQLRHTALGPGEWLTKRTITRAQELTNRRVEVKVHWVAGQVGVNGNEQVDKAAKEVTGNTGIRRAMVRFTSLAHVNRTITESE